MAELFGKMEDAVKKFHEKQEKRNELDRETHGDEKLPVEKSDVLAMLISALIVIVPAVLIAIALLVGLSYLILLH